VSRTDEKKITIECTKEYPCRDDVLGLPWSPGARLDLPEGVAKRILKASSHSFKEVLDANPGLPRDLTEEDKKTIEREGEVK
jgi:hypothetical protein